MPTPFCSLVNRSQHLQEREEHQQGLESSQTTYKNHILCSRWCFQPACSRQLLCLSVCSWPVTDCAAPSLSHCTTSAR